MVETWRRECKITTLKVKKHLGEAYLVLNVPLFSLKSEKIWKIIRNFVIMKHFKTISSIFIIIIAIIFVGNVFYMIKLYGSIRNTVEKDVMTAIADADLDELLIRLENKEYSTMMKAEEDRKTGEKFSGIKNKGTMMT